MKGGIIHYRYGDHYYEAVTTKSGKTVHLCPRFRRRHGIFMNRAEMPLRPTGAWWITIDKDGARVRRCRFKTREQVDAFSEAMTLAVALYYKLSFGFDPLVREDPGHPKSSDAHQLHQQVLDALKDLERTPEEDPAP